ncbi:MAG: hypothetical protein A2945_02325 [Candidatus Liptonbacteria bacterium RIFCSPLOWO2_01_FULL_52_25]|uniref:Uncharacterized protein n=1 Tax=Candidatus Liptonbacteria bacterium RIFCSPLOWO2_01_FULL_52_25 TaxID=1798650 RepID=A0A1G2CGE9_9BACT|nr:MAG: hypothetical protein A2945_02325 [Candidatus Liptonbacteria bacterium RIFCSPLOWO2_01_FULL_52_25]
MVDIFSVIAMLNDTMSINLTVKQKLKGRRVTVEMDADRLERLAASFGFLNPDFIGSLNRAEKDYEAGRYRKIHSLRDVK